jgi:two-component system alkaline phosphatase synthesis response regulator PhoP
MQRMTDSIPKCKPRVLVFDEDPEMGDLIGALIRDGGFEVSTCRHLRDLSAQLCTEMPDLLVSEAKISEGGLSILWALVSRDRTAGKRPPGVLLISDVGISAPPGAVQDGFRVLLKPFDRMGLLRAVRSLTGFQPSIPGRLQVGPFCLDTRSQDVECDGSALRLTASEFRLFHELLRNAGEVLTRDHLIAHVQGEGVAVVDRAIDTHVVALRKKLGPHGGRIETVRGSGYRVRKESP